MKTPSLFQIGAALTALSWVGLLGCGGGGGCGDVNSQSLPQKAKNAAAANGQTSSQPSNSRPSRSAPTSSAGRNDISTAARPAGLAPIPWAGSYNDAMRQASSQNKLVMLEIGSPNCGESTGMNRNMSDPSVASALGDKVVGVYADGPTESNMRQSTLPWSKTCPIEGKTYPVICFIDPSNGQVVQRSSGIVSPTILRQEIARLP